MSQAHSKRKTSAPSSPSSKRQRLSPPAHISLTALQTDSPHDSLSSLSPTASHASSPDSQRRHSTTALPAVPPPPAIDPDYGEEDGEGEDDDEDDDDDDLDEVALVTASGHQQLSAKSVPSKQPRPLLPATGSKTNGARPAVGGKGKKGEEALEHAVAAREEVERRRVELKEAAAGAHGAPEMKEKSSNDGADVRVKMEDDDGEVVVVHGEEADEIAAPPRKERPAMAEERANIISFRVVTNDCKPESMIILTGLKNVFQKQLPKMPREYIARLVFDRAHYSMAIVKRGLEVVGGITYRPFEGQKFAEIVFCAITGTEQVKGYGSHMMNHFKDHVKATTSCMHFLTYADNYAIGYFKKQGFSKEIKLDRSVWAGYIKDYEGGTIMHCSMLPRVKYLDVAAMLAKQKEVILSKIRVLSQSHVVHQGLSIFQTIAPGTSIDPSQVPGLKESGWTPEMDELTRRPKRGPQFAIMKKLLTLLVDHPSAWAFASPVNAAEVTDYYDTIKEPMDLATMENKLEANTYNTLDQFIYDAKLIFNNCRAYNDLGSNYVKNANKLEHYLEEQVKVYSDE